MAGLNHEFLLLSRSEHPYENYLRWLHHPTAIRVHDDILSYLSDTLKGVVCYNPGNKMTKHIGLNWYGPSVIKHDGALLLKQIFVNGESLFGNVPNSDQELIIKTIRILAGYANQVANSKADLYILHLGI